jgi:glycosyltransferase involved in cell wall biosynthesis
VRCDVLFVRGFVSRLAYVVAAFALARLTRARRPNYAVVHGHGGETLLPLLFSSGTPRIVSFCGDDLLGTPAPDGSLTLHSRAKRLILSSLSRFTSATITKSRQMERALPPEVRRRNHVLPNGVDRELFHPIERDSARRRLAWPARQPTALFAADPDVPRKRYELADAACDEARKRGVDVRLEVVRELDPLLMPTALGAADLLLITSSIEGSPNVVKEAMMCNLPVVATDVGDIRELVEDVRPSYVCSPTPPALADAIVACIRRQERSNGREVAGWLDERLIAGRLISIYETLAGRPVGPSPA